MQSKLKSDKYTANKTRTEYLKNKRLHNHKQNSVEQRTDLADWQLRRICSTQPTLQNSKNKKSEYQKQLAQLAMRIIVENVGLKNRDRYVNLSSAIWKGMYFIHHESIVRLWRAGPLKMTAANHQSQCQEAEMNCLTIYRVTDRSRDEDSVDRRQAIAQLVCMLVSISSRYVMYASW